MKTEFIVGRPVRKYLLPAEYPCVKVSESTGLTVYFYAYKKGVVLVGNQSVKAGFHSETWFIDSFRDLEPNEAVVLTGD